MAALKLLLAAAGRKWLLSVACLAAVSGVMGAGYGLGFSLVWLGCSG